MSFKEFVIFFRMADSTFGINRQALAMLAYLSASEIEGCQPPEVVKTWPVLLDGKTGIALLFKKHAANDSCLLVFVGEAPNDERAIVKTIIITELNDPLVGPTYRDFERAATVFKPTGDICGVYGEISMALLTFML